MQYLIWGTCARRKAEITPDDVIASTVEIVKRGLPRPVVGTNDRCSATCGIFEFYANNFLDAKGVADHLPELGFVVALWIKTLAGLDSEADTSAKPHWFFVRTRNRMSEALNGGNIYN